MRTIALLLAAALCGPTIACLSSPGEDAPSVDSIEQEATDTVTIDCNDRDIKVTCGECGNSPSMNCCPAHQTCTVLCDAWYTDPRTGKKSCP